MKSNKLNLKQKNLFIYCVMRYIGEPENARNLKKYLMSWKLVFYTINTKKNLTGWAK